MASEFKLPEVGEGIEAGTVVSVLVKVGDTIELDQPVLELETDKAVVEVPSSVAGVVESISVTENDEAQVGQAVLTVKEKLVDEEADAETPMVKVSRETTLRPASQDQPPAYAADSGVPHASNKGSGEQRPIPAAPSVRRLAREMRVDIRQVGGSGILGRVKADDVRRHADSDRLIPTQPKPSDLPEVPAGGVIPQTPVPPKVELPDFSKWGETRREPMSGIRKATVRSMSTAWGTVPMVTHFDRADITELEKLRKQYGPRAEAAGAKLTPTAIILKVVAGALKKFPDFNASIDTATNEIVYKDYVNVGVAVDTERGLLVPVIKQADQKNMITLAKELGDLAEKARDRKLGPDDMQGGNFSVSNLGGIGGTSFTPIVNPPAVAILGVSRGGFEPVWNKDKGEFEPRLMMPLSVTYDHRLIDGAAAARFLRWVCQALEKPFLMSLEG